jgi:hypothetical protein
MPAPRSGFTHEQCGACGLRQWLGHPWALLFSNLDDFQLHGWSQATLAALPAPPSCDPRDCHAQTTRGPLRFHERLGTSELEPGADLSG